jgi:drug/metabolite transporter (DMT)-like permease
VGGLGAQRARVWVALPIVYVVWGSTYLGILLAIRTIPIYLMGAARFLTAGLILFTWSRLRDDGEEDRLGWRQWAAAAVVGGLLFLVGNTGVAWAEKRVATGTSSLVVATIPLWMALFDRLAYGQGLSRRGLVGLVLGFVGVGVLAGPTGADRIDAGGFVVLLVASAAWAAGSLYSRYAPLPRRGLVSASMQMIVGGALLAIVAASTGELSDVSRPSTESLLALGYLVCVGSIVAFTAYSWLLRNSRTSLVATYAYVNPLVAVFLGWAIEHEGIGVRTVLAGALILISVALIVSPARAASGAKALTQGVARLVR